MNEPLRTLNALRGTGRTTRMLQDVIKALIAGKKVYMLYGPQQRESLIALYHKVRSEYLELLSLYSSDNLFAIRPLREDIEWRNGTLEVLRRGAPNLKNDDTTAVFADHAFLEDYYGPLLEAWACYSLPRKA